VEVEKVKKRLFLLLAATLLCIGMTWDASAKPSNQPKQVIFGMAQFQTNLDPALDWNGWYVYMYGMGETLVKFNEKMEIQPLLADSWQRVNALTWKFHIRKGVTFHNGRPVTAAAVKTSLERSLRLNKRAQEILLIDLIAAQGQELTITTKTLYEAFLGNMADPLAIVVDATAPESTFAKAPVGTGPFKIKSYRENEQVTVEKYQGYWGAKALLDRAVFKYIKDGNTRAMALQNGEVAVANYISSSNIALFEGNSNYKVDKISSLRIIMSYFNFDNELLKDPAVRQAIALGVDRKTYAAKLLNGTAVPAVGPFPTSLPFGGKNLKGYSYNRAAAVKLLSDAGYKDTDGDGIREKNHQKLEFKLALYTTRTELPILGEAIQAQLKEIGIGIKLESYESVSHVLQSKNFDLCLYSVNTATTGDPQAFLELYYHTGGSTNYGRYSNKKVDALIDKLRGISDTKARNEIALEAQQIVLNDNADLFLVTPMLNIISKRAVSGIKMYPVDYYFLNNRVKIR
jgi:peptide/nickel transport system substrate-binding protein